MVDYYGLTARPASSAWPGRRKAGRLGTSSKAPHVEKALARRSVRKAMGTGFRREWFMPFVMSTSSRVCCSATAQRSAGPWARGRRRRTCSGSVTPSAPRSGLRGLQPRPDHPHEAQEVARRGGVMILRTSAALSFVAVHDDVWRNLQGWAPGGHGRPRCGACAAGTLATSRGKPTICRRVAAIASVTQPRRARSRISS